jgi:hypothetical protein
MIIQIVVDVIFIYVIPAPNQLHHNNDKIAYAITSNFIMEPIKFVPLYYVAITQPIITAIEAPFVLTPIHNIVGIKSKPQTPRGT